VFEREPLGPPGVYFEPSAPPFALTGVRMDVCAFAGVPVRGPARVPIADDERSRGLSIVDGARPRRRSIAIPVESVDEYRRIFGGFDGPGLLPYAVASFFAQGGRRAYVIRVVHEYGTVDDFRGVARGVLRGLRMYGGGLVRLRARSEGTWGNRLQASVSFTTRALVFDRSRSTGSELAFSPAALVPPGTLLRLHIAPGVRRLSTVSAVTVTPRTDSPRRERRVTLADPIAAAPESIEEVSLSISINDGDRTTERFDDLGFSPMHPRWVGAVLADESELVWPSPLWYERDLIPDDDRLIATPARANQFRHGRDRFADVTPEDFFDPRWMPVEGVPGNGVLAMTFDTESAMLCVPDLYSPAPLDPIELVADPPSVAGAEFVRCQEIAPPAPEQGALPGLDGLRLDPTMPSELARIIGYQQRLVEVAELMRRFVVLLDVPPGLQAPQVLRWRRQLSSAFAAAYHPWLGVATAEDARDTIVRVPPSAFAAGIIARRELQRGVPFGPANVVAAGAVVLDRLVLRREHTEYHSAGINVYVREPDGLLLTSARTLSDDPQWRQLSVRRLVTQLVITLERQMQWVVFEPHTPALRRDLARAIRALLREWFLGNAFAGTTDEEAYFVRCDETLNDQRTIDAGQLIAEIGVAPAEPLEFIVVRLVRSLDGLQVAEA